MPVSALQVARTGLEAQDARMRVIANNLANVGTTGYKRDRANFATLTYQDVRVAGARSSGETAYATGLNLGTGVSVESTSRIMTQGAMNPTGNAYDLALDGDGYFQIQMPGGQLGYTRAGNFTLSSEGQIVTQQGYTVLPAIQVPEVHRRCRSRRTGSFRRSSMARRSLLSWASCRLRASPIRPVCARSAITF